MEPAKNQERIVREMIDSWFFWDEMLLIVPLE